MYKIISESQETHQKLQSQLKHSNPDPGFQCSAQHSPVHSYVNSLGNVFFQLFHLLGFSLFCCELPRSICFFMSSGCKERCNNKQNTAYGVTLTAPKWILLFLSTEYVPQMPKQLQLLPRFLPAPP